MMSCRVLIFGCNTLLVNTKKPIIYIKKWHISSRFTTAMIYLNKATL